MALESATYISDLNAANPAATDGLAQADDHFRLIKGAVKATFPNVTGAISATHTALDAAATFASGISASAAEINVLDGISAGLTSAELSILDGVTATTANINLVGTPPIVGALAQGSVVVGNASAAASEVTIGTSGTVLTSDGTDAAWAAIPPVTSFDSGMVQMFANTTVPTGWLECDGAAVSRTTYATLFAAIATTYGVGDGSSTFTLPDMRGEFPRGFDNSRGVDSGRGIGTSQAHQMVSHTHGGSWGTSGGGVYILGSQTGQIAGLGPASVNTSYPSTRSGTSILGNAVSFTGDAQSFTTGSDNRPRNVALMFCIKV